MKRVFTIILMTFFVIICFAEEKAIYVYRNDGDFNAFFVSDIDSITYSEIDADNECHDNVDVQVIWTKDSVYRIPTDVIDSISPIAPTTKLQPNVVRITCDWLKHLVSVKEMTLTFASSITEIWTPTQGAILYYESFDETFPDGFVGRVATIKSNDNYEIICDSVESIDEIYETLFIFGNYVLEEQPSDNGKIIQRLVPYDRIKKGIPHSISLTIPATENVSLTASLGLLFVPLVYETTNTFKFEFKILDEESIGVQAEISHSFIKKVLGEEIRISAPLGTTPLRILAAISPYIEFNIESKLEGHASIILEGSQTISISREGIQRTTTPRTGKVEYGFSGGFSGNFGFGVTPSIGLSTIGDLISERIGLSVSTGLESELKLFDGVWDSADGYSLNRDAQLNWYVSTKADLITSFRFLGLKYDYPLQIGEVKANLNTWYFFPEISQPECRVSGSAANISINLRRQLILPVEYGLKITDDNKLQIKRQVAPQSYRGNNYASETFQIEVNDLDVGRIYTATPFVRAFGNEFNTENIAVFTLESIDYDIRLQVNSPQFDTICQVSFSQEDLIFDGTFHWPFEIKITDSLHNCGWFGEVQLKGTKKPRCEDITDHHGNEWNDRKTLTIEGNIIIILNYQTKKSLTQRLYSSNSYTTNFMCPDVTGYYPFESGLPSLTKEDCSVKVKIQAVKKNSQNGESK